MVFRLESLLPVMVCVVSVVSPLENGTVGEGNSSAAERECVECHSFPSDQMHPLAVVAPAESGLPLSGDGQLTCLTCHDSAGLHAAPEDAVSDPGLRLPKPRLCAACHANPAAPALRLPHATASSRIHAPSRSAAVGSSDGTPDAASRSCLGCHDGSVAATGTHDAPGIGPVRGSHPVGVRYSPFSRSGQRSRLRPVSGLPGAVQLQSGLVGCTSCHNLYSSLPRKLVMSNARSALCMACHGM